MKSKRGFVFDTTCLNYFALTDSLHLIKEHLKANCFIPREVRQEINNGIKEYPALKLKLETILNAEWLHELRIDDLEDLRLFSKLIKRWGRDDRNHGEAAALVLARRYDLIAVIDDPVGRRASKTLDVLCTGTVGLIAMLVAIQAVDEEKAWRLHDQMTNLPSPYRSPIKERIKLAELVRDLEEKKWLDDFRL